MILTMDHPRSFFPRSLNARICEAPASGTATLAGGLKWRIKTRTHTHAHAHTQMDNSFPRLCASRLASSFCTKNKNSRFRYVADPGTPFYENYPIITGTSNGSPTRPARPTHHAVVSGAAAPPMASAAAYAWRDADSPAKQEPLSRATSSDAGGGGAAAAGVAESTAGTAPSETSSIGNSDRRESGGGEGSSRPHGVTEITGGRKAGLKHEDGHQALQQRERGELSGWVAGGAAAAGSGGEAARENNQQAAGGGGHRAEGAVGGGGPTGIQKDGARSDQWR